MANNKGIKVFVICEGCGLKVFGNSEDNANANLKIHKKSKVHKLQMSGATIIESNEVRAK